MVAVSVVGTLEDKTPQTKWIRIPVYAVLIDSPEGKVLYDTGCHPEAMAGYWSPGLRSIFPYYRILGNIRNKYEHLFHRFPSLSNPCIQSTHFFLNYCSL